MRQPVAVIEKVALRGFVVFCDDGSVWLLKHVAAREYVWEPFTCAPLPGSPAAADAEPAP